MFITTFDDAAILLFNAQLFLLLFLRLLFLELLPFVAQIYFVVIWLNTCFVPDIVSFSLLLLILVKYGSFEVRQWFQWFILEFAICTFCEFRMVTSLPFRVIIGLTFSSDIFALLAKSGT